MTKYDNVVTLAEIIKVTKATDVDLHYHDLDEGIGAEMLAYNDMGLLICGVVRIVCERPRLAFARALSLYEEPEWYLITDTPNGFTWPNNSQIGRRGFGYVPDENGDLFEIKHFGRVVIGNEVVVREYVTIDRGTIGDTIIGDGCKIDHHCHIAHNCKIGKNNSFANACSIEGSVEIGDNNTFGSNVTVLRKVKIGSGCTIGSGAVVTKDVPDGEVWVGNPARKLR